MLILVHSPLFFNLCSLHFNTFAWQDMFGVTALMKFAAWDKVDLLELLLSKVCEDSIYLNLSSPADGFTALHHAASMNARRTFSVLSTISVVDATLLDKQGYRTTELAIWLR